jgi:lipopolysaccharide transport system permease protein
VGYSTTRVPEIWHWHGWNIPARLLYSLNPMVGVIDGFRWCLLRGESPLDLSTVFTSLALTLILCASGIWYFRKMERTFADVI